MTGYAYAQPLTDAAENQANQLILQQEREKERQQQERDLQRQQSQAQQAPQEQPLVVPAADTACTDINSIILEGASLLSAKQQKRLTKPYINQCLGLNKINQLLADITNSYITRGYITSRAYIAPQDLNLGELKLIIIEGKISEIQSDSPSLSNKSIPFSFPTKSGRFLNLRDLEQGIDQLNRLSSGQAKLKLIPGDQPGESTVDIDYQKNRSRWQLLSSIDNSGQKSTGREQLAFNYGLDNPFGIADTLSINLQTSLKAPEKSDSQNIALHYDLPMGYWNVDLDINQFDYKSQVQGNPSDFSTSGDSAGQTIKLSRLWHRNQLGKFGQRLSVKRKDNENFIEDTLLNTSSRTLASTSLETWYQRTIANGTWSLNLFLDKGLSNFGGENDNGKSNIEPKAEYTKTRFNANYTKSVKWLNKNLNYSINFNSQQSHDKLYSADQISIGSQYTVRGFKQQSASGNRGYYIRQNLSGYLPGGNGWMTQFAGRWQLGFGLDWGKVKNQSTSANSHTELSGYGLKISNVGKPVSLSIEYGKALNHPDNIAVDKHDLYISLNYRFNGKA